jgi:hypothetical protein
MEESKANKNNLEAFLKRFKPNRKALAFSLCLFIATSAWIANALTGIYETVYVIPLSYQNQPFSTRLEGDLPQNGRFHYQGTGWELLGLYLSTFPDSIVVDLGGDKSGKAKTIKIRSLSLVSQLPASPLPYKIEPEWISPGLVNESSKKIPVIPLLKINYKNRFDATGLPKLYPDSVRISGPPQALKGIASIKTFPIQMADVFSDVSTMVELEKQLPAGVFASHNQVKVFVPVSEFTESSLLVDVNQPSGSKEKIKIIPSKVKITFRSQLELVGSFQPNQFKAEIQLKQLGENRPLMVSIVKQPEGVKSLRIDPPTVEYLIEP